MRSRSRSSIAAIVARPPRLVERSSSSSGSTPSRITPPSRRSAGGSSTRVLSTSWARSNGGSRSLTRRRTSGAMHSARASAAPGRALRELASATRSRGPAVPRVTRPRMRSRSCTPPSVSRRRPRSSARKASSSTASRRSWMRSSSTRGRRILSWRSRAPMGVRVWSRTSRSVPRREPSTMLSVSSRLRRVTESMIRRSPAPRVVRPVTWVRSRFWVSWM